MKKINYRKKTASLPQSNAERVKLFIRSNITWNNLKGDFSKIALIFLGTSSVVLLILTFFFFDRYLKDRGEWLAARDELLYWEEVAKKQETSPDAYFEAGLYAAKLRDKTRALSYLKKAIVLDPGFEEAKKLARQLVANSK